MSEVPSPAPTQNLDLARQPGQAPDVDALNHLGDPADFDAQNNPDAGQQIDPQAGGTLPDALSGIGDIDKDKADALAGPDHGHDADPITTTHGTVARGGLRKIINKFRRSQHAESPDDGSTEQARLEYAKNQFATSVRRTAQRKVQDANTHERIDYIVATDPDTGHKRGFYTSASDEHDIVRLGEDDPRVLNIKQEISSAHAALAEYRTAARDGDPAAADALRHKLTQQLGGEDAARNSSVMRWAEALINTEPGNRDADPAATTQQMNALTATPDNKPANPDDPTEPIDITQNQPARPERRPVTHNVEPLDEEKYNKLEDGDEDDHQFEYVRVHAKQQLESLGVPNKDARKLSYDIAKLVQNVRHYKPGEIDAAAAKRIMQANDFLASYIEGMGGDTADTLDKVKSVYRTTYGEKYEDIADKMYDEIEAVQNGETAASPERGPVETWAHKREALAMAQDELSRIEPHTKLKFYSQYNTVEIYGVDDRKALDPSNPADKKLIDAGARTRKTLQYTDSLKGVPYRELVEDYEKLMDMPTDKLLERCALNEHGEWHPDETVKEPRSRSVANADGKREAIRYEIEKTIPGSAKKYESMMRQLAEIEQIRDEGGPDAEHAYTVAMMAFANSLPDQRVASVLFRRYESQMEGISHSLSDPDAEPVKPGFNLDPNREPFKPGDDVMIQPVNIATLSPQRVRQQMARRGIRGNNGQPATGTPGMRIDTIPPVKPAKDDQAPKPARQSRAERRAAEKSAAEARAEQEQSGEDTTKVMSWRDRVSLRLRQSAVLFAAPGQLLNRDEAADRANADGTPADSGKNQTQGYVDSQEKEKKPMSRKGKVGIGILAVGTGLVTYGAFSEALGISPPLSGVGPELVRKGQNLYEETVGKGVNKIG